jgi:hypothetical protein
MHAVRHEDMRFLCVATPHKIVLLLWAPKPYYKFMLFKEFPVPFAATKVDLTVSGGGDVLQVALASAAGFHTLDVASGALLKLHVPHAMPRAGIAPVAMLRPPPLQPQHPTQQQHPTPPPPLLLVFDTQTVAVDRHGDALDGVYDAWEAPPSSAAVVSPDHLLGWTAKAIEFRDVATGRLRGVFRHKRATHLSYLCTQGSRVYFSSTRSSSSSQIYFMLF